MIYNYRNPAITKLSRYQSFSGERADYTGIALKALYFVVLTFVSAAAAFVLSYDLFQTAGSAVIMALLIGAPLLAFIFAMVASFKPLTTPVTGTLYAILQGLAMGFISLIIESAYSGVVFAALISTVSVLMIMLVLYSTGIIRVGAFFKKFMISALLGALAAQLIIFVISLFSPAISDLFYGTGNFSILISIIMVILASLMILFDLQRITETVESGLDKRYEWAAAFGLLVTIIWLYMEFLRLFAKIAARRK
jgi:uncharacterized YccA/Bax inhibitor family protein